MRRKAYEELFFLSFMILCPKSPVCKRIATVVFIALQSFLIAAAIIIATYSKKTLHCQLRKVMLSGMYNYIPESITRS